MSTTMTYTTYTQPSPPPTSNTLTAHQRTRLLRSTNKIGRVLGSTPHLLDARSGPEPVHVHLPIDTPHSRRTHSHSPSNSSSSSRSSSSSSSRSRSRYPTPTPSSPLSLSPTYTPTLPRNPSSSTLESWRTHHPLHRPPLLRLAPSVPSRPPTHSGSVPPALSPIPASPSLVPPSTSAPPPRYTLTAPSPEIRLSGISFCNPEPTFPIPTESALRRQKMDRISRRLGEGVPVDLVFPTPPPLPSKGYKNSAILEQEDQCCDGAWKGRWNRRDFKEVNADLRKIRKA